MRSQQRVVQTLPAVSTADTGERFGILALFDPSAAQRQQAARDVNGGLRVGVDTGRVKQTQRWIGFAASFTAFTTVSDYANAIMEYRSQSSLSLTRG